MKFNDDHKTVNEFSDNFFGYGVHSVQISGVELGTTDSGKEYIEITVVDPGDLDVTDSARVWFSSDKAINYSFNVLRQIFVHCAPEAKKDEARAMFDQIGDTDTLAQIMEKCVGRQCWFTKYPSPDRTYTAQDGTEKPSVDKNIMGYEPKLKTELMPQKADNGQTQITRDNVAKVFPGAEEVPFESAGDTPGSKAANTVPADSDWDK